MRNEISKLSKETPIGIFYGLGFIEKVMHAVHTKSFRVQKCVTMKASLLFTYKHKYIPIFIKKG